MKIILNKRNHIRDGFAYDFDITSISKESLEKCYKDLRLEPVSVLYGDPLSEPNYIKEAVKDSFPPDDALKRILRKYNLPDDCGKVIEHYHNIFVYVVVADIGENEKLIEADMDKLGYFLGYSKIQIIDGKKYVILQFEPTCQLQDDITDEIKKKFDCLFHWTPSYNVDDIMRFGLKPSKGNRRFNYPLRCYLISGDSSKHQLFYLGQQLCLSNDDERNDGKYSLLSIDISDLDDKIRFYYDPNSEIGIFTEKSIPANKIYVCNEIRFKTELK